MMNADLPPWIQRLKVHTDRVQPPVIRQIGVALIGSAVLLLGILMLPLPGPGSLVIFVGLAVLALEFEWALRWLLRAQALAQTVTARARSQRFFRS